MLFLCNFLPDCLRLPWCSYSRSMLPQTCAFSFNLGTRVAVLPSMVVTMKVSGQTNNEHMVDTFGSSQCDSPPEICVLLLQIRYTHNIYNENPDTLPGGGELWYGIAYGDNFVWNKFLRSMMVILTLQSMCQTNNVWRIYYVETDCAHCPMILLSSLKRCTSCATNNVGKVSNRFPICMA